jgi:hypothetical protein
MKPRDRAATAHLRADEPGVAPTNPPWRATKLGVVDNERTLACAWGF